MAAWRSTMPLKTPRLSRRRASLAKKPSTALSQEAEVGVKWKWKRWCRSSQARTPRFREGRLVWGFRCQGLLLRQSRP